MSSKQIASAPEAEFSTLKPQPSGVSTYLRQIKDKRLALFKDRPARAFTLSARLFGPRTLIRTACVHWSVLLCVIVSVVDVAVVEAFLGEDDELRETFSNSSSGVAILGGLLSFVLVFRTNVCYSRWWEGRCLWGGAIFSTICSEPQLYRLKNFYSLYVHMPVLLGFSIATVMCTQMYISPCPDPPFDSRQEYHLIPSA